MKKLILAAALIMIGLPGGAWAASDADKVTALKKQVEKAQKQATTVGAELRDNRQPFCPAPRHSQGFLEG